MNPTIGRMVIYRPTDSENALFALMGGNPREQLPATVVAANESGIINMKVHTDSPGPEYWKQHVIEGNSKGEWSWPVINPAKQDPSPALNVTCPIPPPTNPGA